MKKRTRRRWIEIVTGVMLCLFMVIQPLSVAATADRPEDIQINGQESERSGEISEGASAAAPDVVEPDAEEPNAPSDMTESDETEPDETESDATESDGAEPDTTESDEAEPDTEESAETTVSQEQEETTGDEGALTEAAELYGAGVPHVSYRTHVQTYGWMDWVLDGKTSGTEGKYKRLEGINIELKDTPVPGGIEYKTHVQTYGWMNWVSNGKLSGTEGKYKRLEAIQIRLTGEMEKKYDVYYRVHCQTFGWMGWAKNGAPAGSMGYGKRLEGIQIVLVGKGGAAPGSSAGSYREDFKVTYQTYVETYGWLPETWNGQSNGTTGEAKRLEAIKIHVDNHYLVEGSVEYRVHAQTYGWMDWVKEGNIAGTVNKSKRLEGIEIRLTGDLAKKYDIYYRVHCQTYGWTGWGSNGEPVGSEGYGKRVESIEIKLVAKGGSAPGSTQNTYYKPEFWGVDVSAWQETVNWKSAKADGVEFAMLRITQKNTGSTGGTVMADRYFEKNAQGALANGIPIGGYVYCYASTPQEAAAEAEFAVSLLKKYHVTYPIAFDLEEPEHMTTAAKLNNMAMAKAYCSVLQKAGYKTVVYGSPSKLRRVFDYNEVASTYGIWLARYRWDLIQSSLDFNDAATRTMVRSTGYEGGNYTGLTGVKMWQYTEQGRVNGIPGNVDLDLSYTAY